MQKVLVIGATSAIAIEVERIYAQRGDALCLVARKAEKLDALAADLRVRGASLVHTLLLDANDLAQQRAVLDTARERLGGLDAALIAHGTLGDQKACEASVTTTLQELNTNALSVIALCTELANVFEAQGRGTLAVIGSVAGDRGKQSNYVYGAAKAAVTVFLQGLRSRLFKRGVLVVTIKPGFVDTPMTAAIKKGPLFASAAVVASGIVKAMDRGTPVVYLPWFWRYIMLIICSVPEKIFRKLSL
jgi:short-subunit dehydrogenase